MLIKLHSKFYNICKKWCYMCDKILNLTDINIFYLDNSNKTEGV